MRRYNRLFETEFAKTGVSVGDSTIKGVSLSHSFSGNVEEVWASVSEENELRRKPGNYVTYSVLSVDNKSRQNLTNKLCFAIKELCGKKSRRILVLGMGNSEIISDSLGVKTIEKIDIKNLNREDRRFAKFCPGVFAVSGFHSFEIVSALNSIVLPDTIIVVDSLCAGSVFRLGKSFQVSDAGITPGSAMGENICNITSATMGGARVISIGVPVVIYLQSVLEEATEKLKPLEENSLEVLNDFDGIFSPKEIDEIIDYSSDIIASAIIKAFT